MNITDPIEITLIKNHREQVRQASLRERFQKECPHTHMRYDGHSHNDDCYRCDKCGYIEWR